MGIFLRPARAAEPADPDANPTAKAVLNYLASLADCPDHKLIIGQWCCWGGVNTADIQRVYDQTGQWLGLIGADYYREISATGSRPYPVEIRVGNVNPSLIDYWQKGALIQIDAVMPNPQSGRFADDTFLTNFNDVLTPGTTVHNNLMQQLDLVAAGLQELQSAGVVVLFRPYNEVNGGWFWWAKGGTDGYKKLWIMTFNYLTQVKGLHNLLWVYAPWAIDGSCISYYPGDQYVDIVGSDIYGYGGGVGGCYSELTATGKPFAAAEFGIQTPQWTVPEPPGDMFHVVQEFKTHMPKAVYLMAWAGNWNISKQLNINEALNDPYVQNRPIPYDSPPGSCPVTGNTGGNTGGGGTYIPEQIKSRNVTVRQGEPAPIGVESKRNFFKVFGVPPICTLSAGKFNSTSMAWELTKAEMEGMTVICPPDFCGSASLTVVGSDSEDTLPLP